MAGWGKPKYSSGPKGKNFNLKEGDNVYRFLPPMHSFADEGLWSTYVSTHFGYYGTDPTDSNKTRLKTFKCIQKDDRQSGMVLEECPECTLIEDKQAELKDQEATLRTQFKADGMDEKEIEETLETALAPIKGWLKQHNVDRKHHMNVMTPSGEFGQLKLSHRTKKQLDAKLKELNDEDGIDPLDLEQGVLINIKRTGKMRDVVDTVEVVKEKVNVNGKKMEQILLRPLTEDEANAALENCRDLATAGGYVLTKEQIQELTESSGDPEEVDRVFSRNKEESKKSAAPAKPASKPADKAEAPAPKPAAKEAVAPKPEATEAPKPTADEVVQQRLAALKAKKEAEAKKAAEKAAAEAAAAEPANDVNPLEMSDDDFLAKFGS